MSQENKKAVINQKLLPFSFCHIGAQYVVVKCWVDIDVDHADGSQVSTTISVEFETDFHRSTHEVMVDDEQYLYDSRYGVSEEEHLAIAKAVREFANDPKNQTRVDRPGYHPDEVIYAFLAKRDDKISSGISDNLAESLIRGLDEEEEFTYSCHMMKTHDVTASFDHIHEKDRTRNLFLENKDDFLKVIEVYTNYTKELISEIGDSPAEILSYNRIFKGRGITQQDIQEFLDEPENTDNEDFDIIANAIVTFTVEMLANSYNEYKNKRNALLR